MRKVGVQGFGYQSLNLHPVSLLLSQVSGIRVQDRMYYLECRGGVQGEKDINQENRSISEHHHTFKAGQ